MAVNPNEVAELHASRPGKKTLGLVVLAVLLFVVIKFWEPIKAFLGVA